MHAQVAKQMRCIQLKDVSFALYIYFIVYLVLKRGIKLSASNVIQVTISTTIAVLVAVYLLQTVPTVPIPSVLPVQMVII
jgi:hypothetical protein